MITHRRSYAEMKNKVEKMEKRLMAVEGQEPEDAPAFPKICKNCRSMLGRTHRRRSSKSKSRPRSRRRRRRRHQFVFLIENIFGVLCINLCVHKLFQTIGAQVSTGESKIPNHTQVTSLQSSVQRNQISDFNCRMEAQLSYNS